MIYFVSDTHYGHANIVKGISKWTDKSGCRPFDDQQSHDDWVVRQINDRVGPDDTLFHLGDWSFGGKHNIVTFAERLIVECIVPIIGNHDHHIEKEAQTDTWLVAWANVPTHYKELDFQGLQVVLCHYPLESWNNMERGSIHLHGHVHGKGRKMAGRYDVGLDALGLISLDEIKALPKANDQRHPTIHGGNKFAESSSRPIPHSIR